jgi:hypothetical protein
LATLGRSLARQLILADATSPFASVKHGVQLKYES